MLFKEIIAVYPENHKKAINTMCGQNAGLLAVNQVAHIVATRISRANTKCH
jgi:hypothetical protein